MSSNLTTAYMCQCVQVCPVRLLVTWGRGQQFMRRGVLTNWVTVLLLLTAGDRRARFTRELPGAFATRSSGDTALVSVTYAAHHLANSKNAERTGSKEANAVFSILFT